MDMEASAGDQPAGVPATGEGAPEGTSPAAPPSGGDKGEQRPRVQTEVKAQSPFVLRPVHRKLFVYVPILLRSRTYCYVLHFKRIVLVQS